MKLSEIIRESIELGDASRAYWDRELPRHHPNYPLIRMGEDSGPPPPEDAEIQKLLQNLPEDQVYALILLMYLGRGDFSPDHLLSAYEKLKETFPSKQLAIAQIMGKGTLAEYLTDAMEEMQKRNIDVDSLDFKSAMSVS